MCCRVSWWFSMNFTKADVKFSLREHLNFSESHSMVWSFRELTKLDWSFSEVHVIGNASISFSELEITSLNLLDTRVSLRISWLGKCLKTISRSSFGMLLNPILKIFPELFQYTTQTEALTGWTEVFSSSLSIFTDKTSQAWVLRLARFGFQTKWCEGHLK